ncbi:helix-turn-helix transcriptional regulator [Phytopseudomonas dryadis]|uniref:AraC family transcriptional regulator n=1 Tax=Phytopseudomonas dryadis TaxID=2487520 RepID=A0A4Q9RAB4_9GAMM|nr:MULTISPECIES: AraC family transcriptional regulator [Pseudomonas]TBU97094.1 AraC family transcriptional regulator [Pseudomonas dryadis]TBV08569.1 AraC family transcriptional regulator [Pseudomonas dryadis]TBV18937.1 AraC family transcriptional regulator [Pseudomonas sp. FRB 230]
MSSMQPVVPRSELIRQVSPDLRLIEAEPCRDNLFRGQLRWLRLRAGLSLHCSDCHELHNFSTQVQIEPRLNFILFLEGHSDVRYGDHAVRFGSPRPAPCEGVALSLSEPVLFSRQAQRGTHIRKLVVSLAPEWFDAGGLDDQAEYANITRFTRQHLALRRWQPSPRLLAMAEQILHPPGYGPLLENLYLESRSLEIASEALAMLCQQQPAATPGLRPQEHQRIRRVVELLDSGEADGWTLEAIARDAGININSLQRQFQASQGMTLFEYQRVRKLQQAREALERQGVSVAQAAWLAGYGSAANFATAFKRQFGLTPKQVRTKI